MGCKQRLEQYLRDNGVAYEEHSHAEAFTAQEVAAQEHVSGKRLAKVVMVVADGELALLVLPAHELVDLQRAAQALGAADVRLAREEEFADRFPDCDVGAMPPFGNLYGFETHVDEALTDGDEIVFQAGTHRDTMTIAYRDFARLVEPKVGRFGRLAAV